MSRRTFYEHFEDLRGALLELHEDASNRAFSHVEERTRAAGDPIERLRAGIEAFLTLMADEAELARVLFREIRAAGPRFEARHEASQARYVALLFEGIADAYAKGVATRPPDELTIFALVSGMEAVAMRYLLRREEARAKQAAPVLVDLVLRAFR
jgi:AcrR family transcriptional regulator